MLLSPEIWKMLAGIAIFMLGMNFLEGGLKQLAGRPFKLFLKKQTTNKVKAIAGGTVVTALLQSSSIVNLMVLAFVGASIISMQNALAVILGSNLGTTFSSWIIATVGFKFNIESFALPIAGISGISMLLANKESRLHSWSRLFFGFSFLFVGLNYMKESIESAVKQFDLGTLNQQPVILFLLAGFIITSLIQSSSATVAIVLSALHANAIGLLAAMAIVLGSETGTSLKLVLASIKGIAAKKRVALGNILFNLIITVIIFIFLVPLNIFIAEIVGIKNNLMALVFFQSLVNLAGIILFFPFLNTFGRFLERRFRKTDKETLFIHNVKPNETELAIAALEKEIGHYIYHVAHFTFHAFEKKDGMPDGLQLYRDFDTKRLLEKYEYIKHMHGEIYNYSIRVENMTTERENIVRIRQLIASSRNIMYAAKSLKDTLPDIEQLKRSSNDTKYDFYHSSRIRIIEFYHETIRLLTAEKTESYFEELKTIYQKVQQGYKEALKELYREDLVKKISEVEFSTLLNFNREMYTVQKSILFALKDQLLNEKEAAGFDELPGFIR